MKMKAILFLASVTIFTIIFSLISCTIISQSGTTSGDGSIKEQESMETAITTAMETETSSTKETEITTAKVTETTASTPFADQIKVTNPVPGQIVKSPLLIEGEARGTWYFEASFPIKLLDANGNQVAAHFAQAQGEWMTEDFVPFKAQIEFTNPDSATGILVLEKDNPSGLPENDAKIEIPVRFDNQPGKIVEDTNPQKGEYFVYAILKNIDVKNNKLIVEQLINGPNEKEIPPEVVLSKDCKIVKVILEIPDEKETVSEITLDSIKPGSEIGIIFKSDNTARAIIYQEIIENN